MTRITAFCDRSHWSLLRKRG